jgi:hypothetical protein
MFYLAFGADYEPHKLWMHIVVDGQGKVAGVANTLSQGHDAQGTNFVVLHLHKGDSVWVTTFVYADVKIYGSRGFTSFSGVLLYEYLKKYRHTWWKQILLILFGTIDPKADFFSGGFPLVSVVYDSRIHI